MAILVLPVSRQVVDSNPRPPDVTGGRGRPSLFFQRYGLVLRAPWQVMASHPHSPSVTASSSFEHYDLVLPASRQVLSSILVLPASRRHPQLSSHNVTKARFTYVMEAVAVGHGLLFVACVLIRLFFSVLFSFFMTLL